MLHNLMCSLLHSIRDRWTTLHSSSALLTCQYLDRYSRGISALPSMLLCALKCSRLGLRGGQRRRRRCCEAAQNKEHLCRVVDVEWRLAGLLAHRARKHLQGA